MTITQYENLFLSKASSHAGSFITHFQKGEIVFTLLGSKA